MKLEKAENMCFNSHHQMSLLRSPQINKFEQISSNDHQMSLAGEAGPGVGGDQGLMPGVRRGCRVGCVRSPIQ